MRPPNIVSIGEVLWGLFPEGARFVSADQTMTQPGVATEVRDTVGAGDALTAAFLIGLLRGDAHEVILASANKLAAAACSQPGAVPDLPLPIHLPFHEKDEQPPFSPSPISSTTSSGTSRKKQTPSNTSNTHMNNTTRYLTLIVVLNFSCIGGALFAQEGGDGVTVYSLADDFSYTDNGTASTWSYRLDGTADPSPSFPLLPLAKRDANALWGSEFPKPPLMWSGDTGYWGIGKNLTDRKQVSPVNGTTWAPGEVLLHP